MICPKCMAANENNATKCRRCGADLKNDAPMVDGFKSEDISEVKNDTEKTSCCIQNIGAMMTIALIASILGYCSYEIIVHPKSDDSEIQLSNSNHFTDSRDGQSYKYVVIGSQTWMAENLNFETDFSYKKNVYPEYGRYYLWEVANIACPSGWHLPSVNEWEILIKTVGGKMIAGKKLKSQKYWKGYGTNEYGFSAVPAGNGNNNSNDNHALFWTSSPKSRSNAFCVHLRPVFYEQAEIDDYRKDYAFSVRCIKD